MLSAMHKFQPVRLASALGLALVLPMAALAQDQRDDSEDTERTTQQLETVFVTAQKRSERLQDVPMSVAVMDATKLATQGQVKLSDYFTELPGLSYKESQMSSTITLRGIGTEAGIGTRPTAGVTIDDVPYGSATNTGVLPDLDPSDLQQIEVLRGPQGTLYGASSMGGLVKYVTVDPDTRRSFGQLEVGGSSSEHGGTGYDGRAAANIPVSGNFALRVSAFQREDPWFVHNLNDDAKNSTEVRGGRIAALWNINDKVTVRSAAMVQDTTQDASATVDTDFHQRPIYGQYVHNRMVGTDGYNGQTRFYSTKITADLNWATLDSITGYSQHRSSAKQDVSYTTIGVLAPIFINMFGLDAHDPGALIDNRYDTDKFSQEVRLASRGDHVLQWQVGGFYTRESTHSVQDFYLGDRLAGAVFKNFPLLISEGESVYKEYAVFTDVTYRVTDRFDIGLGGRYAKNRMSSVSDTGGLLTDTAVTTDGNSDQVFTYSFSPRYKFGKDLMGYFRVASGYRAGGSNGDLIAGIPTSYKSDTLVSYEAGLKGLFLGGRLNLDAAVYFINWSDLQLSQRDLTYGSSYTTNAGKAYSRGVELTVGFVPTVDWRFDASLAITDATLAEDIPGYVDGSTAYGKKGDRLPFAPRFGGTVSATRYFDLSHGLVFSLGGRVTYAGGRYMEFTQSQSLPRIHLPAYTTLGLNAGLEGSNWTLTAYLRNLTDEKGYINANRRAASVSSGTNAVYGSTLIQPRTAGVNVVWSY